MNLNELNSKYGITMHKLRRMQKRRHFESLCNASLLARTVDNIRNGKLTALSIALSFKFRSKPDSLLDLTRRNGETLGRYFGLAGLPASDLPAENMCTWSVRAVEQPERYLDHFVQLAQSQIPGFWVPYEYLVVRILLSCETDHQMNLAMEFLGRAPSAMRKHPAMRGWVRKEQRAEGGHRFSYRKPAQLYDL